MIYNFDTQYTELDGQLFERVPRPSLENPEIILLNQSLLRKLGIKFGPDQNPEKLLGAGSPESPFAQAYAGHQFGHFTNLGDGRAMVLGEHLSPENKRFDIQLKGSGRTKYSRGGDGLASAGSMIREYIYSHAMNSLGVSTSESLAVLATNQRVARRTISEGAVLIRVMSSHIRFGTFEYISRFCSEDVLRDFTDYTIARHFPELHGEPNKYLKFCQAVTQKTIEMVVDWYRVGFIHGVMNTDNMSIVGETFDYGPCAFMNGYDPATTYSEIDHQKRYAFGNQAGILKWNLSVFGVALLPLFDSDSARAEKILKTEIEAFDSRIESKFIEMMKGKLGITGPEPHADAIQSALKFLGENKADYTNTFIELMDPGTFGDEIYRSREFQELRSQLQKVGLDPETMINNNPQRIPRNYLVEEAIEEFENHRGMMKINKLVDALSSPYKANADLAAYQKPPSEEYDEIYATHCNT